MSNTPGFGDRYEPPPRSKRGCWYAFFVVLGVGVMAVAGLIVLLAYVGTVAPETSVYPGDRVPEDFVETLHELEALEPDEELVYFYSDGLLEIEEGFYFVSDRKVVVYIEDDEDPLLIAYFEQIATAELVRNTSFFEDSTLTLVLNDGVEVWFPVSSEGNLDVEFHRAIEVQIE